MAVIKCVARQFVRPLLKFIQIRPREYLTGRRALSHESEGRKISPGESPIQQDRPALMQCRSGEVVEGKRDDRAARGYHGDTPPKMVGQRALVATAYWRHNGTKAGHS
jgi:hypothetical protein